MRPKRCDSAAITCRYCVAVVVAAFGVVERATPPLAQNQVDGAHMLPTLVVQQPKLRHVKKPAPASNRLFISVRPASSDVPGVASGPVAQQSMACQIRVPGDDLRDRPVTRPGEVLEAAPGLIVTQHSREGKASQYFLRGYNLDHGTDMAIWVDDVPVNMRTHAHGQGYADLNWLMPETIKVLDVRKGPPRWSTPSSRWRFFAPSILSIRAWRVPLTSLARTATNWRPSRSGNLGEKTP